MPSTGPPDILARRLERLTDNDLRFLVENFPEPAASYEDIARIFASLPITLESTLDAEYAYRKIFENGRELVEISPFLLFNVLLHRCIGSAHTQTERVVVNMANLLGLFVCTERVYRPEAGNRQSYEYFVALAAEAARADERRRFLLQAHIGNYALYLRGIFRGSLAYRRRYKRRPVDVRYYADMGRVGYRDAASTRLARVYKLDDVFLRLATTTASG